MPPSAGSLLLVALLLGCASSVGSGWAGTVALEARAAWGDRHQVARAGSRFVGSVALVVDGRRVARPRPPAAVARRPPSLRPPPSPIGCRAAVACRWAARAVAAAHRRWALPAPARAPEPP